MRATGLETIISWRKSKGGVLEASRFLINGMFATALHFGILFSLIEICGLTAVGVANGLASLCGTAGSYIGCKYFVFDRRLPSMQTLPKFLLLYAAVALVHAMVLTVWSDILCLNYSFGFIISTAIATVLAFFGSRSFVFSEVP